MKRMKLVSAALAVVLALILCVPSFAAGKEPLTRGEFVSALFERSGVTGMEPKQAWFGDVEMHGDLALAVRWAVGEGIVKGYGNGKFGPDDPVTREQMATMLYRNAQALGQGFQGMWYFPLGFPDADRISDWADEAMHWCVMKGILIGTGKGLEPKATATDEQLALVLARWDASLAGEDAGQNPAMNFIGEYASGRASALVEAKGAEDAKITIEWGSSAWELTRWVMSGRLDADTLTLEYTDCVKTTLTYADSGELVSETVKYENGTGRIIFLTDGTFTWKGDQSEQEDLTFAWSFVPPAGGIDYLALVNKRNALPDGWEEALETVTVTNSVGDEVEVEARAYEAYAKLARDLEENDGVYLELDSARRSVAAQQDIMDRFTEKYGADYAAKTVAQPGYSEHHTGLALDLYFKLKNTDGSFTDVYYNEDMVRYPEIWEKIHAKLAEYGFILRYPEGREHITGYGYEPWHIRYLDDPDIAAEITEADITLEEYLAGAKAPEVAIDYGASAIYTRADLDEAIVQIKCRFAFFGCELHSLSYLGDEADNADNLAWMNELDEGKDYTQVCAFTSDFHAPADAEGAWEADREYTGWKWWLARSADGGWQLLTWGY